MNRLLKTGSPQKTLENLVVPFANDEQIELLKDNSSIENTDNLPENNPVVPASNPKHRSNKRVVKRKYNGSYLGLWFTLDKF